MTLPSRLGFSPTETLIPADVISEAMSWLRRHALGLVVSLFVVTLGLMVVIGGIGALFFLPYSEEMPIGIGAAVSDALGSVFVPLVLGFLVLVVLALVLGVSAGWLLIRRIEPGLRLHYWLARVERSNEFLSRIQFSTLLFGPGGPDKSQKPSAEDRRDRAITALKRRYVAGDLTDSEFERQLEQVFRPERRPQNTEQLYE